MAKTAHTKRALEMGRGGAANKSRKDPGVPKLIALKKRVRNHDARHTSSTKPGDDTAMRPPPPPLPSSSIASLAFSASANHESMEDDQMEEGSSTRLARDNTVAAHAHQFKKVLELSDVVIQVLDARDPMGCRSRLVEDEVKRAGGDKMMILALNKTDLVPKDNVLAWLRYLRHDFPTVPLKSTPGSKHHSKSGSLSSSSKRNAQNQQGAPHLLSLLKSYRRAHTSLTIGVVGPPNVGKSSLINALSRLRGDGKDAVTVGAKAGETRAIKEVGLEKGLKILDMPGIVWGDFLGDDVDETEGGEKVRGVASLSMVGVEDLEDPVSAVEAIVSRIPSYTLQHLYNIPTYRNAAEFLTMVALTRGRLGKGGAPDHLAAARSILNDWNAGTIPYHTIPPKIHTSSIPSAPSNIPSHLVADPSINPESDDPNSIVKSAADVGAAQYVSKFSQPFDLEGLFLRTDREVLDEREGEDALSSSQFTEETIHNEMEDMDTADGFIPDTDLDLDLDLPSTSKANKKRAHSPTASIATTSNFTYEPGSDGRRVKAPKPKRTRYNSNAPIVFDAGEIESMALANPLNRKRQKEQRKRREEDGMVLDADDDDGVEMRLEAEMEARRSGGLKAGGGAFALLAEADVPLPAEDEDEDI